MTHHLFISRRLSLLHLPISLVLRTGSPGAIDAIWCCSAGSATDINAGSLYYRVSPLTYGVLLRTIAQKEAERTPEAERFAAEAMMEIRPVYEWLVDAWIAGEFSGPGRSFAATRGELNLRGSMDALARDIVMAMQPGVSLPRPNAPLAEVKEIDRAIREGEVAPAWDKGTNYIPLGGPEDQVERMRWVRVLPVATAEYVERVPVSNKKPVKARAAGAPKRSKGVSGSKATSGGMFG